MLQEDGKASLIDGREHYCLAHIADWTYECWSGHQIYWGGCKVDIRLNARVDGERVCTLNNRRCH